MIGATTSLLPHVRSSHTSRPHVPFWIVGGVLYLIGASLFGESAVWTAHHPGGHGGALAVRLVLEAAALLWASRRPDQPRTLRRVLVALGVISLVTTANLGLSELEERGLVPAAAEGLDDLWILLSYVTGAVALLVVPRAATRRDDRWTLPLDTIITAGTLGALLLIEMSFPLMDEARRHVNDSRMVLFYGLAQIFNLVSLNVVVVCGAPMPSRRAFWWFVAGQASYAPVLAIAQLELAGLIGHQWLDGLYMIGVVPTLVGAVFLRYDAADGHAQSGGPSCLRGVNPLLLLAPLIVSATLVNALRSGPPSRIAPLSVLLMGVAVLLALRVFLLVRAHGRLEARESDRVRRLQAEKLVSVGELAGGVAHELGNVLTVVGGRAELAMTHLSRGADAIGDLEAIRAQAQRAADLAERLAAFSGQRAYRKRLCRVADVVREGDPLLRRALPAEVRLVLWCASPDTNMLVDPTWLVAALERIVRNAGEAIRGAGTVTVSIGTADLTAPLDAAHLPVGAGRYVSFAVADDGEGIDPADLPRLFDPFFTRRDPHPNAGLGLAEAYGIIAHHEGGIAVESARGRGTTVTVYLPAAAR